MKTTMLVSTVAILSSCFSVNQVLSAPVTGDGIAITNNAAAHVERQQTCVRNSVYYDDNFYKVPLEYIGDWTHLTKQGSTVNAGTLSYTGERDAAVVTPNPFPVGEVHTATVTVWSTKKRDRGRFSVYVGNQIIGAGDQFTGSSHESGTQRVFYRENVQIEGGQPIAIKNENGAEYMAFDALELEFCDF